MNPFSVLGSPLYTVAEGASTAIDSTAFMGIINKMSEQLSVSTVVEVLTAAVGACIALVFMWWGARKVAGMLMKAFKRGKLRI